MSFNVAALAAYIEDQDFPILAASQAKGITASLVTKQVGIKESSNLNNLATDVVFQEGSNCTRSASGTTTFSKRKITVGDIAIYEDLCPKDLNGYWMQKLVGQGAAGEKSLPGEIEAIWLADKAAKLERALEVADWQGDTTSGVPATEQYDGFLKLIDAGSPVDGNTGAVTVATGIVVGNVIALLQGIWGAIPVDIQDKEDLAIFMGNDTYRLYVQAMINANLYHFVGEEGMSMLHGTNVRIVPTVGLNGTDRMIAGSLENFVIGMDGEEEMDFVVRLDPVTQKSILFDANFKRGTQVRFDTEIVEFTLVP